MTVRQYQYVGPPDIAARAAGRTPGVPIYSAADLAAWLRQTGERSSAGAALGCTFVVDATGVLRLADRRSEHVACAGGVPVLAAGELFVTVDGGTGSVAEASNHSTGYCPEPTCWPAVAAVLDKAGVPHPGRFTKEVVFRRCEKCGQRNVVRDGEFVCGVCGGELPPAWNFGGDQ